MIRERPWFVFAGGNYYPQGGMDDYVGAFSTEEQALSFKKGILKGDQYDWCDVVDIRPKFYKEVSVE